jgi:hypothetical protein
MWRLIIASTLLLFTIGVLAGLALWWCLPHCIVRKQASS